MRINGHAHIFNLQTVLTTEAVDIIADRLRRNEVESFIANGVRDFLRRQLERPEYLTEDGLLRELLRAIARQPDFKEFLQNQPGVLPIELKILGETPEALGIDLLRAALNQLSALLDRLDGKGRRVFDVFETLRLAMKPDIVSVADALLSQNPAGSGLIALMMDIVATPEPPRDKANFLAQIRGTADAALARPGRIFPFIAVNPNRLDHLAVAKRALESQGFVGVKLYPSLGYEVTTPAIREVIKHCVENDTPVLIHTTSGGFFKSKEATEFSHPRHWVGILRDFPSLRLCFGHCGGWGGFSDQDSAHRLWWNEIIQLMAAHPNVYGDLSYHVEMRDNGAKETAYFQALKALLADANTAERIIFGTDSWLVRLSMSEEAYWKYFEENLTAAEFRLITETAPAKFLGIPRAGEALAGNLARHVRWLESNADKVGAEPAPWVDAASTVTFTPTLFNPGWSPTNRAHVLLYQFLRFEVKQIPKPLLKDKFAGASKIRLHQLSYFTKGHEPDAMFQNRCRENGANLDAFLLNAGAGLEGSRPRHEAVASLTELFVDGGMSLGDAGSVVDAMYLFKQEIE